MCVFQEVRQGTDFAAALKYIHVSVLKFHLYSLSATLFCNFDDV